MRELIVATIRMAILDWNTHKDDVRAFFKSEWGKSLCEAINVSADVVLHKLETNQIHLRNLEEDQDEEIAI